MTRSMAIATVPCLLLLACAGPHGNRQATEPGNLQAATPPADNSSACASGLEDPYNYSVLGLQGVSGVIIFRVQLDERGKVTRMWKLRSFDPELDAKAASLLRDSPACRFSPAKDQHGRGVPFVIEEYTFIFGPGPW